MIYREVDLYLLHDNVDFIFIYLLLRAEEFAKEISSSRETRHCHVLED